MDKCHPRLGQIEVSGDLTDRLVPALAQLSDLGFELRPGRPTPAGASSSPMLSTIGHPSWGEP
jgi:hypothetical protein